MVAHLLHLPSSTQGVTVDSTLLGAICKAVAAIVCNLSDQPVSKQVLVVLLIASDCMDIKTTQAFLYIYLNVWNWK